MPSESPTQHELPLPFPELTGDQPLLPARMMLKGYGEWVQLSVFQRRLSRRRQAELQALLDGMIVHSVDHVIIMDLGPADQVKPRVTSLGKAFEPIAREPLIV